MTEPLVSTAWLQANLGDPTIRIVDLRGGVLPPSEPPPHYITDRAGYEESHIPGAVFVDWQVDIVEPGSPSNDIAAPESFAELMGVLGIGNDTTVIAYDNTAGSLSARFLWCLRHYGHTSVSILDGGWPKWIAEGRPVDARVPVIARQTFAPAINERLKATGAEILNALDGASMQLIDVRSPAEYTGEDSRAERGGHIPTAINLPRRMLVADDNTLKPKTELRQIFVEAGVQMDAEETVLYCNSGVSACFGMLAMERAGASGLRIYDGSWKDWGSDLSKPIAR